METATVAQSTLRPSIPTFLLVKNGEVAHQIIGALPYEKFKAAVESHL